MKQRPVAVIAEVVSMLDSWASIRRALKRDATKVSALVNLARVLDPDDYRDRIRALLIEPDLSVHKEQLQHARP